MLYRKLRLYCNVTGLQVNQDNIYLNFRKYSNKLPNWNASQPVDGCMKVTRYLIFVEDVGRICNVAGWFVYLMRQMSVLRLLLGQTCAGYNSNIQLSTRQIIIGYTQECLDGSQCFSFNKPMMTKLFNPSLNSGNIQDCNFVCKLFFISFKQCNWYNRDCS